MSVFINFSNHPSFRWSEEQLAAARSYGDIMDLPFPNVSPTASTEEVQELAEPVIQKIIEQKPAAVMCQGEFTLSVYVISQLVKQGILVLTACSERVVTEKTENGELVKTAAFHFVQFRPYVI